MKQTNHYSKTEQKQNKRASIFVPREERQLAYTDPTPPFPQSRHTTIAQRQKRDHEPRQGPGGVAEATGAPLSLSPTIMTNPPQRQHRTTLGAPNPREHGLHPAIRRIIPTRSARANKEQKSHQRERERETKRKRETHKRIARKHTRTACHDAAVASNAHDRDLRSSRNFAAGLLSPISYHNSRATNKSLFFFSSLHVLALHSLATGAGPLVVRVVHVHLVGVGLAESAQVHALR